MGEKLFLKDRPTYAANFKLLSTPKNILAETLEMSLIDLFPNISTGFGIFLIFLFRASRWDKMHIFSSETSSKLATFKNNAVQIEWTTNT